jgi:tRNA(Ile)-lysidine synthase
MKTEAAEPLRAAEFASRMDGLGGFEKRPHLAVAVSGGADSMALSLLAAGWVGRRRGEITALIVDHGLRPESAAEGRQVAAWLDQRDIPVRRLAWTGAKPETAVQEAARTARYRLMAEWCRDQGVLHLLLGHHQGDQAETVLMRLAGGSGADGLAAMPAIVETAPVRLLRPLLDVRTERLRETLRRRRQSWIEDPSNRDLRFLRPRLRAAGPALAEAGVSDHGLADAAAHLGAARRLHEADTAALLARACRLDGAGIARLSRRPLMMAPDDVGHRAFGRVLACVGGAIHVPAAKKVARLLEAVRRMGDTGSRTLGGCRIIVEREWLLVCRESRHVAAPVAVVAGSTVRWDNRFRVTAAARPGQGLRVGSLGRQGWSDVVTIRPDLKNSIVPPTARSTLPALMDGDEIVAVPHIGYVRNDRGSDAQRVDIRFWPRMALSPIGFFLA